jgi:uncharacterized protein (TIGR02453 family)
VTTSPGFSDRALSFYEALAADNTKEFWHANKQVYDAEVRDPMLALLDALEPEFGAGKAFRPYRDTRFSHDKSPYKTYQGAFVGVSPGIGYYVQIDATGLLVGGGYHVHAPAQTDRYRQAVDVEESGTELEQILSALDDADFDIDGAQLKTKPRGYAADHPRIELLRYKELMASKPLGAPAWLRTPETVEVVRNAWRSIRPLSEWVITNVGTA